MTKAKKKGKRAAPDVNQTAFNVLQQIIRRTEAPPAKRPKPKK